MFAVIFFTKSILFVSIQENKEGLELLKTAIEKAGYTGKVICLNSKILLQRSFDDIVRMLKENFVFLLLGCHWNGCCCI